MERLGILGPLPGTAPVPGTGSCGHPLLQPSGFLQTPHDSLPSAAGTRPPDSRVLQHLQLIQGCVFRRELMSSSACSMATKSSAATRLAAISSPFQRGNRSLSSSKHRFQASIFHLHTVRWLQAKRESASSEHVRTYPRSSIRAIQRIAAVSRPAHTKPLPQRAYDAISPHL